MNIRVKKKSWCNISERAGYSGTEESGSEGYIDILRIAQMLGMTGEEIAKAMEEG